MLKVNKVIYYSSYYIFDGPKIYFITKIRWFLAIVNKPFTYATWTSRQQLLTKQLDLANLFKDYIYNLYTHTYDKTSFLVQYMP